MKCPTLCSYMLRYVSRDMWLLWIVQIYVANMRFPVLWDYYEVSSIVQSLWGFQCYVTVMRCPVICSYWGLYFDLAILRCTLLSRDLLRCPVLSGDYVINMNKRWNTYCYPLSWLLVLSLKLFVFIMILYWKR